MSRLAAYRGGAARQQGGAPEALAHNRRHRNHVERRWAMPKEWRFKAIRYEKIAVAFTGVAAALDWIKN